MRKRAAATYRCIYSKTKNVYTISCLDDDRNILCETFSRYSRRYNIWYRHLLEPYIIVVVYIFDSAYIITSAGVAYTHNIIIYIFISIYNLSSRTRRIPDYSCTIYTRRVL